MPQTRPYRVLKGNHSRWVEGKLVRHGPGDTIYLTEAQARRMTSATGSMVEPLWTADEPVPEPAAEPTNEFPEVLGGPIRTVREYVSAMTNPKALQALYDAEVVGKNRSGALNVIGERLAELEGGG